MRRSVIILLLFCALCMLFSGCSATSDSVINIRINEVQTAGTDADWIELYNAGTTAVRLDGCFVSDDEESLGKWMFPHFTLKAGEYVLLYADKSNSTADRLSLPFALKSSGETVILSDPNGHILDKVTVPASAPGTSYGRDADGSFVWYAAPTPAASNEHGMVLGKQSVNETVGVCINEYMSRNRSTLYDQDGDYGDWVELANITDHAVDLSDFYLTDSKESLQKWQFPRGTTIEAGGYLLVFCSGKSATEHELHASFKLGESDSFLGLYTAEGVFCSGLTLQATEQDRSVGHTADGTYAVCHRPTPGYANIFKVE